MKRNEIDNLLPAVFQRTIRPGNPLAALLEVMEALHAPSEGILERLDAFFAPYRTPDRFVPYLARWVDMEWLLADGPQGFGPGFGLDAPSFPSGVGRLRELITAAAFLSKWRGTARGLLRFLEMATGARGFEIHEHVPGPDGKPRPFHLLIRAPAETAAYRALLERIVEMEKPAYTTYEIEFA